MIGKSTINIAADKTTSITLLERPPNGTPQDPAAALRLSNERV
jgi:hypothetical protein